MIATKFRLTKEDKILIENKLIEKDLTKKELANRLFVTNVTLSCVLNGKKDISKEFLNKLEKELEFVINCKIDF